MAGNKWVRLKWTHQRAPVLISTSGVMTPKQAKLVVNQGRRECARPIRNTKLCPQTGK